MELYNRTSYDLAKKITNNFSTSFSLSSRLFGDEIRHHIYAIYGLVRIADEIVDTYRRSNSKALLDKLHKDTIQAIDDGYSTNPIIHAFALTANRFDISDDLIAPFFASMAMDINTFKFNENQYRDYIYGSAEVIGLMCLKVFTDDKSLYELLKPGARSLGSAYQKVNFLRDMKSDYDDLGRVYFPRVKFETFDDGQKSTIIADIKSNFDQSQDAMNQLPNCARKAVLASYLYYTELLNKMEKSSADEIKNSRIRVSDFIKIYILLKVKLGVAKLKRKL